MRSFYVFSLNGLYECEQHWICPLPKDFPNGNRRICLFSINFSYFRENCTPFQSWTRIKLILMQFHNNFPFCLFTLSRENLFPNCFSFFFLLLFLYTSRFRYSCLVYRLCAVHLIEKNGYSSFPTRFFFHLVYKSHTAAIHLNFLICLVWCVFLFYSCSVVIVSFTPIRKSYALVLDA